MEQIQALKFDMEEVGKHVKGSKKRYTWEVALNKKSHVIVLDFSFISGKVKITVDRKILLQNEQPSNVSFQYPFALSGFALNIIQQGESFELRINNKVFSHLYTQQKTNTEFKKYEEEVKDIKVDLNGLNNSKKISLNIGAFGTTGMKKKKEQTSEGHNWDAFGKDMAFPSYFEGTTSVQSQKQGPVFKNNNLIDEDITNSSIKNSVQGNEKAKQSILDFDNLPTPIKSTQINSPSSQLLFEIATKSNQVDDFNTMQNLFQSTKISQPKVAEIDFFAEMSQPSTIKESIPQSASINNTKSNLEKFNLFPNQNNAQSINNNAINFSTGFNYKNNNLDNNMFATTNISSKVNQLHNNTGFNLDFTIPVQQSQKEKTQLNLGQGTSFVANTQVQGQSHNNLTDININDFNAMQKVFQSNSLGLQNKNLLNQSPTYQVGQSDFSTLRNLFQTTNFGTNQNNLQQSMPEQEKPKQNAFDLFANNNPISYSTISGQQQNNWNMANFSTTVPSKNSQIKFDFLAEKPAKNTNDNLI